MTRVDFYLQARDRHDVVRRLCGKALAGGARIAVLEADAAAAQRLSRLLWCVPSTGFLPHCAAGDPLAAMTPIIVDHRLEDPPHDDVLVNLRPDVPPVFSRFRRVIEIVTDDDDDKRLARERFRFYRDRGYAIETHDLAAAAATRPAEAVR